MNQTDWIGFIGVALLLCAFFLNLKDVIKTDDFTYLSLNLLGASLACLASMLLNYLPFIILEACWAIVSLIGLYQFFIKKFNSNV